MSETMQAPVAQTFTFEKKMGESTLTFTVSVLLLGMTQPTVVEYLPRKFMQANFGESLWFYTVTGPAGTQKSDYWVGDVRSTHFSIAEAAVPGHCTPVQ